MTPHTSADPLGGTAAPDRTAALLAGAEHEQVVFCRHQPSGLRAIIAVHSTALGPALGGTRFHPYASDTDALADVLELSRAMTYKNALAGLDHGGGKAVIIGDPRTDRTEVLLRAYGRFVASLGGRYVTAADVGTQVSDMDVIGRESRWVTGRSPADGGAGDSSVLTAWGVFQGLRAGVRHVWDRDDLTGLRVAVTGVGKVGSKLAVLLADEGAHVVVHDVDADAVDALRAQRPEVQVARDDEDLLARRLDVFAPCALGHAVDDRVSAQLVTAGVRLICGAANNQLAHPGLADDLHAAGVVYAPDYVVNSGGVIQVADELHGFTEPRARTRATAIGATTRAVLELAVRHGSTPQAAATTLADRRIAEQTSLAGLLVPR